MSAFYSVWAAFVAAVGRMDKSLSPADTFARLRAHKWSRYDLQYVFMFILAVFWLYVMETPPFPYKLLIPLLYTLALIIPFTSQFFLPATPILSWVLAFFTSRSIPVAWRPHIYVSVLPTIESVLYGANISDILTRVTHPILDVIAWVPYGVVHYTFPFFVAAFLWLFRPKASLHFFGNAFGYMNLTGVLTQLVLPCAPPWYELRNGLLPADYTMKGSPGGLARIDALFGSQTYTTAFTNSPLVFGAFPSLHAGFATLEALFMSHFFPRYTKYIWGYTLVLYWATMYLTHHYLIDVVGGACLATAAFHLFMPEELSEPFTTGTLESNNYTLQDLEARKLMTTDPADFESDDDEEREDISFRSPAPGTTTFAGAARKSHKHKASTDGPVMAGGAPFSFPQAGGKEGEGR